MKWTTNWLALVVLFLSTLLAGCGAGNGGGPGSYTITLRVDRAALPLNIGGSGPNIGGPYTATLYVSALDDQGRPIPGGEDIFSCSITSGLDSGALYYLDGDPDHERTIDVNGVEVTVPIAFRSITLGSNSGSNSFHVTASDTVGAIVVRCSVFDPTINANRSVDATIQVGGPASGKASQVLIDEVSMFFPGYIFVQESGGTTQVQMQAQIVDEAGQPVPNPAAGVNNLQVRIVPNAASLADDDATLRAVNAAGQAVAGSTLQLRSINGRAQFTVVSGKNPGAILIEAVADRSDNNVGNGMAEPIVNFSSVPVVVSAPTSATPVTITTASLPAATGNVPYGALLEATGGTPPYTWSLIGGALPSGITLATGGVLSGTPGGDPGGTYNIVVQVRDSFGTTVQRALSVNYTAPPVAPTPSPTPVPTAPSITTATLSNATQGQFYANVLVASGGTTPYTWSLSAGSVPGLTLSASTGIIQGTPTTAGTYPLVVTVTGGGLSASRALTLTVSTPSGGGSGSSGPPTLAPSTLSVSECTTDIPFIVSGGTPPFSTFSTDSVNVPTTTPVAVGNFYVFTVSTSADTTATSYTVSVLDALSQAATATISVPINTHAACPNNPKLTLSPTFATLNVGNSQQVSIQGAAPAFVVSSSDTAVATVGAVSGPDASNAYTFSVNAVAVGTVIVRVQAGDGQNAFIPIYVVP